LRPDTRRRKLAASEKHHGSEFGPLVEKLARKERECGVTRSHPSVILERMATQGMLRKDRILSTGRLR